MIEQEYINGRDISLKHDDSGSLCIEFKDGRIEKNVKVRRLLPVSQKYAYINFIDENKEEIGILKDLNELNNDSRKVLERELEEYYLIPKVQRINKIGDKYGIMTWDVETDLGVREFEVRTRSADIKVIPPRRVIIRDSDDNRYEIPDYLELPHKSYLKLQGQI